MNKHTPGPWEQGRNHPLEVFGPDGIRVANCASRIRSDDEAKANTQLISAAPDLLEALIELRNFYIEMTGLPPIAANAAIAKSRGEKP